MPKATPSTLLLTLLAAALSFAACTGGAEDSPLDRDFTRLAQPAEVLVDDWGNTHIYAADKYDASFLQCYTAAHQRLFQIDFTRRYITGRLAEWMGADKLEDDKQRRVIGFERIADDTWRHLLEKQPATAARVLACSGGVNAYLSDAKQRRNGARLTQEFAKLDPTYFPPAFRPQDAIAFAKGMSFSLSFSGDFDFFLYLLKTLAETEVFDDLVRFAGFSDTYILEGEDRSRWGLAAAFAPLTGSQGEPPFAAVPPLRGLTAEQAGAALRALEGLSGPHPQDRGSNNWVVSGEHTKTGFPLIANDPHLSLQLPSNFLETHLVYQEDGRTVDVTGIMLAGGPGVLIGHNRDLAWAFTTTMGDVTDLYFEKAASDKSGIVLPNGRIQPFTEIDEPICVRPAGGPVSACENVDFKVRLVPGRGPLLNDLLPKEIANAFGIISIRWSGFMPTEELTAVDKLNASRSIDEAMRALEHFMVGEQSILMADTNGDIGLMAPSKLPIRAWDLRAAPPFMPLAADGTHDWAGFHPYTLVPQVKNPQKGYVVTANNDPFGTTVDNDPLNDGFYFGAFFANGNRAKRITDRVEALLAKRKLTFEDMQAIQADVHSVYAEKLLPYLLPLKPADCAGRAELCGAYDLLADWDLSNDLDAAAPSLFHLWMAHALRETFFDEFPLWSVFTELMGGQAVSLTSRPFLWLLEGGKASQGRNYFDDRNTEDVVETSADIMRKAMTLAVDQARNEFTDATGAPLPVTMWTWRKKHFVEFEHVVFDEYTYGPVPNDGGLDVVDASGFGIFKDGEVRTGPLTHGGGPNMRYVVEVDPATWRMENIIPGGSFGNPDSAHYTDQLMLWLENKARPVPYFRSDVDKAAVGKTKYPIGFPFNPSNSEALKGYLD